VKVIVEVGLQNQSRCREDAFLSKGQEPLVVVAAEIYFYRAVIVHD